MKIISALSFNSLAAKYGQNLRNNILNALSTILYTSNKFYYFFWIPSLTKSSISIGGNFITSGFTTTILMMTFLNSIICMIPSIYFQSFYEKRKSFCELFHGRQLFYQNYFPVTWRLDGCIVDHESLKQWFSCVWNMKSVEFEALNDN